MPEMKKMVTWDVVIIGAGPAGIAAAIYLKRAGRDVLLLERGKPGGLLRNAYLVENYPGFPDGLSGTELVERFQEQINRLGIDITKADALRLSREKDGTFSIAASIGVYSADAVIMATGTKPKNINLPGVAGIHEKVFHEVASMPPSEIELRGKEIAIIGGGDAAFDYALSLHRRGAEVTILSKSEPCCIPLLAEKAKKIGIKCIPEIRPVCVLKKRNGKKNVTAGITLKCRPALKRHPARKAPNKGGGKDIEIDADYILVACGREPDLSVLGDKLMQRLHGSLTQVKGPVPGLFLAGDLIRGRCRQTGTAVGDGIHAAMLVDEYLKKKMTRKMTRRKRRRTA